MMNMQAGFLLQHVRAATLIHSQIILSTSPLFKVKALFRIGDFSDLTQFFLAVFYDVYFIFIACNSCKFTQIYVNDYFESFNVEVKYIRCTLQNVI